MDVKQEIGSEDCPIFIDSNPSSPITRRQQVLQSSVDLPPLSPVQSSPPVIVDCQLGEQVLVIKVIKSTL